MDNKMFCFQCEQTAGCTGCKGRAGVCGKSAVVARLQDELTGALIGLAQALESCPEAVAEVARLVLEALFTTVTNVNFDESTMHAIIDRVKAETARLGGEAADFDVETIWQTDEDTRSLKSLVLFGLRGMAAYAYHAMVLGFTDPNLDAFIAKSLACLGRESSHDVLIPLVLDVGKYNLICMELLDRANTTTYGNPSPQTVSFTIEKGPFIVITGHDLYDLKCLLEQTEGTGVNVYTHGEMLPAHGYPELRKYAHLKGNFGTAWHNQQREFDAIPAPILFTTNCLMPPKPSYIDRVFTTEVVSYPGLTHIGNDKDFSPVIQKALELGGYDAEHTTPGINGGTKTVTGFAHHAIIGVADKVVEAVKSGAIRHFFVVGGCDGQRTGRNYYTEFARQLPADTVILTLGCGKYRFNDIAFDSIGGIPRLLDLGQCNDAFGAIKVALALAEAFQCTVNELPLSLVLSWYEQKAVCVLLTLLYLGIENIRIGPSLPAFISPNILNFLVKKFKIAPLSTPEADIKTLMRTA